MALVCHDLLGGQLKIYQPERGHRQTMDTLLLAGFVRAKAKHRVLELGSGTGAAALIVAWRAGCRVTGLELDGELAAASRRSAELNHCSDRAEFFQGDLRTLPMEWSGRFDAVMANPPYEEEGQGRPCPDVARRVARQDGGCRLADVTAAAARALKDGGSLFLVMRARRLADTLCSCREAGLEPWSFCSVSSKTARPPFVFLLAARKRGGVGLVMEPPLVLQNDDGSLTERFLTFYGKEGPQWR